MSFDPKKQAHTSTKGNNCLLNCLAPTLSAMLIDAAEQPDIIPKILGLLKEFSSYYKIPGNITNRELCNNLKSLLEQSYPQELEIIFAPVLRHYLRTLWARNNPNDYFDADYGFRNAVRAYLMLGEVSAAPQYSSFIKRNLEFLVPLRERYANFCFERNTDINIEDQSSLDALYADENNFDAFFSASMVSECSSYWEKHGFINFWTYLSDEDKGSMLTFEDVQPLATAHGLSLEGYIGSADPDDKNIIDIPSFKIPIDKPMTNIKLILLGEHWEYEAASIDEANKHNEAFKKSPRHKKFSRENISKILGGKDVDMYSVKSPLASVFLGIAAVSVALVIAGIVLSYAGIIVAAATPLLLAGVALGCISGMVLASIGVAKVYSSCKIGRETTASPPEDSRTASIGTPTVTITKAIGAVPDPVSAKPPLIHNLDPTGTEEAMPITRQPVGSAPVMSS